MKRVITRFAAFLTGPPLVSGSSDQASRKSTTKGTPLARAIRMAATAYAKGGQLTKIRSGRRAATRLRRGRTIRAAHHHAPSWYEMRGGIGVGMRSTSTSPAVEEESNAGSRLQTTTLSQPKRRRYLVSFDVRVAAPGAEQGGKS